jgi:hypothetical protein
MNYTKGKWTAEKGFGDTDNFILSEVTDEETGIKGVTAIATVHKKNPLTSSTQANARLISAAPDMYEALKALGNRETCFCEMGKSNPMVHNHSSRCLAAREALAKAEGK